MKILLTFFIILGSILTFSSHISAQETNMRTSVKDTIPIEDHDYHLTKDEFMYYYGKDDTAKAIIHMFYRKRGIAILDFVGYPILASIVGSTGIAAGLALSLTTNLGSGISLIAAGTIIYIVGFYGIPIYYLVQRSNFSRQKLMYVLLNRERGMGTPFSILDKLRDVDFQ